MWGGSNHYVCQIILQYCLIILALERLGHKDLRERLVSEDNSKMYRLMNTETKHGFSSRLGAKPSHGGGNFDEPRRKSSFIKILTHIPPPSTKKKNKEPLWKHHISQIIYAHTLLEEFLKKSRQFLCKIVMQTGRIPEHSTSLIRIKIWIRQKSRGLYGCSCKWSSISLKKIIIAIRVYSRNSTRPQKKKKKELMQLRFLKKWSK